MKRVLNIISVIAFVFIGCINGESDFNTLIEIKRDLYSRKVTDSNVIITNASKNEKVRVTIKETLFPTSGDTTSFNTLYPLNRRETTRVIELNPGEQIVKPYQDPFDVWKIKHKVVGETIIK